MENFIRKIKTKIINRMALKHIAGSSLSEAVKVCKRINHCGFTATLGFWNNPSEKPESILNQLLKTLNVIDEEKLNTQVAVKFHELGNNNSLFEELVAAAKLRNIQLHFDSHGYKNYEETIEAVKWMVPKFGRIGCTLSARFERSRDDAKYLRDLDVNIRIVKGHWTDPENKVDCRNNFFEIVDALSGYNCHVAIATHDLFVAEESIKRLQSTRTSFELEQLISLPFLLNKKSFSAEIPVRFYIPFGYPYLPYSVRYAAERPEIIYWMIRDLITAKRTLNNFQLDRKPVSGLKLISSKPAT